MTSDEVRGRIVALRTELTARELDAGPVTIAWHLQREGQPVPSTSTIRRVLHAAGLVTPEPRKRPRSSWHRFEAAAPNECWQSDFTHWRLADGSEVEILNWLDDHSRYLLSCTAFGRVSGDDVVATFTAAGDEHGWPAATLTDNGAVYTSRFTGGRNGFEYLLAYQASGRRTGHPAIPRPGQDRALPPDPEALARAAAGGTHDRRAPAPARRLPPRVQRAPAAPGDQAGHPGRGLPGDAQGASRRSRRTRPLPPPLRHRRQEGRDHPAPGRPPVPPQGRCRPCPSAGPGHRRRAGGHGRRPRYGGDPVIPPDRA